jgi:hypothetical protein
MLIILLLIMLWWIVKTINLILDKYVDENIIISIF